MNWLTIVIILIAVAAIVGAVLYFRDKQRKAAEKQAQNEQDDLDAEYGDTYAIPTFDAGVDEDGVPMEIHGESKAGKSPYPASPRSVRGTHPVRLDDEEESYGVGYDPLDPLNPVSPISPLNPITDPAGLYDDDMSTSDPDVRPDSEEADAGSYDAPDTSSDSTDAPDVEPTPAPEPPSPPAYDPPSAPDPTPSYDPGPSSSPDTSSGSDGGSSSFD